MAKNNMEWIWGPDAPADRPEGGPVMTELARRLRHIRKYHPEGPFTLSDLAERTGVSKRTLVAAESAEGTNLTIETLVKVTRGLGIARSAYLLDEEVFRQVNAELRKWGDLLRQQRDAESLVSLAGLLSGILTSTAAHGPGARRR
ncbi:MULTISPECIES: helix-turn-helix domain-containing protein [unclassified Streptomyces]|uniref:helix-turn-helix domain-containing protein n=1 Tax=unclassified Streptomyces TaxID=2593676 RepID=UPI00278C1168|nr:MULTISPECIES: helix-turn-helix domain-containing protein [unclassified Streptomyces]